MKKSVKLLLLAGLIFYLPVLEKVTAQIDSTFWNNYMTSIAKPSSIRGWVKFKENTFLDPTTIFQNRNAAFGLGFNDQMILTKTETDQLGYTHYRYQQYYNGVKIEGCEYIVHAKNGFAVKANGKLVEGLAIDVTPAISDNDAFNNALNYVNATTYMWEDSTEEQLLKQLLNDVNATYFPQAELVITLTSVNQDFVPSNFLLAYKFDILDKALDKSQSVYVNASNGLIIKGIPLVYNCVNATGTTTWNGSQPLHTQWNGSIHILLDDCIGDHDALINTRDWNGGSTTFDYTNSSINWGTANQAAVTSHWSVHEAHDYFNSVYLRNSFDDAGGDIYVYNNTTFGWTGNPNNAAWVDYPGFGRMYIGGGNTTSALDDWNTIDIVGHEFTHGVTSTSAGLVYQYEPGALNESFSDIFGTAVERRAESNANPDWLMGEDRGVAIRDMSNPNAYGDPDTYLDPNYWYTGSDDYGGVHTNSGVQNFWFYLLSTGGTGTNYFGYSYSVAGIGILDAASIAFRNLTGYLWSSSNYGDARVGAIWAAEDLFGECSNQLIQTIQAWNAVGVVYGSPCFLICPTITINPTCGNANGEASVTLYGGTSSPYTYSWNPGAQTTATATGLAAGIYTVTVTDFAGCSESEIIIINDVTAPTLSTSTTNPSCGGICDGSATVSLSGGTAPYTYQWNDLGNQTTATATGLCPGTYYVTVTDGLGCIAFASATVEQSGISLSTSVTNVSCNGGNNGEINLFVSGGIAPYTYSWSNGATSEDITGLMAGTYTVTVTDAVGECVITSTTVTEPSSPLTFSIIVTDLSCNGSGDGAIDITISGGTPDPSGPPDYVYTWSTGATTEDISNLSAGTYSVAVEDWNGCTQNSGNVTVTEPNPILTLTTSVANVSCRFGSDGAINLTVSSGTGPYTYLWSNGSTSEDITGLMAGTYTVSVTDANGECSVISAAVTEPSNLVISLTSTFQLCNSPSANGTTTAGVAGGTPPYTYQWDDPDNQTTETATGLEGGIYNVTVTDANGCIITWMINVGSYQYPPSYYDFIGHSISTTENWQNGSFTAIGEFIVEAGGVLNIFNANIEISYDVVNELGYDYDRARIVVMPGGKVNTLDATLTGCGGGIWDGIEVWGDETLLQNDADQGVLEMDNTTIINADKGIFCGRRPLINARLRPTSGGIVRVTNSTFINNYLAVKMRNYPDFTSLSYFNDCTFEYNSSTPFEYISGPNMEFINLLDHHGLIILGCHFINTTHNDFDIQNRGWGIKSTDASYIIDEFVAQPTIFENLYYGIEATATNSLNSVSITNSKFLNNNKGILLRGVDYAVINENEFDIGEFGIVVNTESYGFYLENCTGYQIETNIIHSSTNTGLFGSYIFESGIGANELYRNEFSNLFFASTSANNNSGLETRCNKYTNISIIDIIAGGSIALDQGFCDFIFFDNTLPAGNQFSYTTSDPEGNILAGLTTTPVNYNYHSNGNTYNTIPLNYTSPDIDPNDCFVPFVPNSSCLSQLLKDCGLSCQQTLIIKYENKVAVLKDLFDGGDKDFLLAMIHQDKPAGLVKNALLDASPYLTDRILVAAINEKPTPLPPGVLKEVILSNSPLINKVKAILYNRIPALPKGIKKEIETVQTGTSARTELEREVIYFERRRELSVSAKIRYYLHNDTIPGAMDSVIAILEQEEILEEIKEKEEIIIKEPVEKLQPKRKLADAYLKKGNQSKAQQKIDTLIQVPEFKNFGKLKQVIIDIKSSDKTYFELQNDPVKETKVRNVAADSSKYGYVHARALLDRVFNERIPEYFITIPFNNNNNISSPNFKSEYTSIDIDRQFDTNIINLYPNPASETVNINYKLQENSKQAIVNIFNVMGKKVISYDINTKYGTLNLDLSNLPSGLYFFNIIVNNNTIARKKLIIIK